jgi:hypothetical protein
MTVPFSLLAGMLAITAVFCVAIAPYLWLTTDSWR